MSVFPNFVITFAEAVRSNGGRALLVGGCVRDRLLGIEPKDFDIEVYGVEPAKLQSIAESLGEVVDAGAAFGILKLRVGNPPPAKGESEGIEYLEFDIGVPRRDSKIAAGHKGFAVNVDPAMSPAEAARRRDFTINAIMLDPLTDECIDPFDGRADLQNRVLRCVDHEGFGDDPLRVLRGMQFAARFDLKPDDVSTNTMRLVLPGLVELSSERLRDEWRKLLVLADKPSIGLQLGLYLGAFDVLHPELPPLKSTPQNPAWHPEGDVWIHTLMVVDEAAAIIRREGLDGDLAFTIMLAALSHDLGKPLVTAMIDGVWRSKNHEEAGEAPTRSFLKTIGVSAAAIEKIVGIVKDHLKPTNYYLQEIEKNQSITDGAIRKLAARIAPATMNELLLVAEADYFGRGQWRHGEKREYPERPWLLERAGRIDVLNGQAPHVISGKELIDLGIEAGPKMGELIREADQMRDDEGKTKEEIVEWINEQKRWM